MTLGIAKEMADRLIEFIIKMFQGESVEDQLTKAIKGIGLVLAVSLFVNFSMFLANLNLRMELDATQGSLAKVGVLFDGGESSALSSFVRVNNQTGSQIALIQEQNNWLGRYAISLTVENLYLKRSIVVLAATNRRIITNNNMLLQMCQP
jgi:hypothetical protein